MSRLRIWSFTALIVVAGLAGTWVFTQRASVPAAAQVASILRSGSLQFETGTRLLARQVRDVAVVASRDPALVAAVSAAEASRTPGPAAKGRQAAPAPAAAAPDLTSAAEGAIRTAAGLLEVETGRAPIVGVAHGELATLRVGERRLARTDPLLQSLLRSPSPPRHVRIEGAIYAVAVVGPERGVTLAFGLPIDPRWTERLQGATGADLTLIGPRLATTLPPEDAEEVVSAAVQGDGVVVDAGRLGPLAAGAGLPGLPVLFLSSPAYRARALSLPGIQGPVAVISAPTRQALEPIAAFQQAMLISLLLVALLGAAIGMAQETSMQGYVPRELALVADRIARGDFDARVPRLSGTYGTVASALARASEAARLARIGQDATASAASVPVQATQGPPVRSTPPRATPPRAAPTPAPFAPPRPPPAPAAAAPRPVPAAQPFTPMTPAPTLDVPLHAVPMEETTGSRPLSGPFSGAGLAPPGTPAPIPLDGRGGAPLTSAEAVQAVQAARAGQPRTTQPLGPEAAAATARATPAPAADDETAWRALFDEFLRVRTEGGETVEGITWDRFRAKLRKNHDALVQKYACRTVRFQVYVKEGKAALRATPIR